MNMPPSLRLWACLILLATCSARPNWHKGLIKQNDNQLLQVKAVDQQSLDTVENTNSNSEGKTRSARNAPNMIYFNARLPVSGTPNFNNHIHPQYQFSKEQHFGPPLYREQFQPPGLHPIRQLASSLQNVINTHLEAAVQLNKEVHFGTLNNVFPHPSGLRPLPLPVCPSCALHPHSFHETSNFGVGHPQIISSGTYIHQFGIKCPESETGCRDIPIQIHPGPEIPSPSKPEKELPATQPSTISTPTKVKEQEFSDGKDSDIVYGSDDKNSKTLEDNAGIDIRFGEGKTEDILPSKF